MQCWTGAASSDTEVKEAFWVHSDVATVRGVPRRRRVVGEASRTQVFPTAKTSTKRKAEDGKLTRTDDDLAATMKAGFESLAAKPKPRVAGGSHGRKAWPRKVLEVDRDDESDGSWAADDVATKGELSVPPKQSKDPPSARDGVAKLLEPAVERSSFGAIGDMLGGGPGLGAGGATAEGSSSSSGGGSSGALAGLVAGSGAGAPGSSGSGGEAGDALAVPTPGALPVPAVPAAHDEPCRPRQKRGMPFGSFAIATVSLHGEVVGFGATCGRHRNSGDRPGVQCKVQLQFGKQNPLSPDECRARVKEWCLRGLGIKRDDPRGRELHMSFKPRFVDLPHSEAEMDDMVDGLCAAVDA